MCNEILPENVNLLLDDFERALCLPVLLGMFYFTVILAIPLGTSIYNTAQKYLKSGSSKRSSCKSHSIFKKIKGMIGLSLFPDSGSEPSSPYRCPRSSDSQAWSDSTHIFDEYDCDEDEDD